MAIERASGGRLIRLYRPQETAAADGGRGVKPSHQDIFRVISGAEEMLGSRRMGDKRRMAG